MKKIFSILLVIALVAVMATGAFAAGASTSVSVSNSAPAIGDTITANAYISGNTGFISGKVIFSYDSSVLELVSLSNGLMTGVTNVSAALVNHASMTAVTGDGVLCSATFKVIGSGDASISITASDFANESATEFAVSGSSASVSVAAPHEHAFGNEWKYDEDCHWRECECGEVSDFDEHDFVEGVCSVCGYEEVVVTPEPTPVPTVKPADPEPTQKPVDPNKSPQTGDDAPVVLLAVMLTVCAAGVAVVLATKKSKASK